MQSAGACSALPRPVQRRLRHAQSRRAALVMIQICAIAAFDLSATRSLCKFHRSIRRFLRNAVITLTAPPALKTACGLKRLRYRL
ncbi:hypothetical protein XAR_1087 [Xanthomonas citri pv. glycines str. 8ra]|nr:hypothetical protein XAR_1087 [Xanthomonas citri pv. glycines str. 8ra]